MNPKKTIIVRADGVQCWVFISFQAARVSFAFTSHRITVLNSPSSLSCDTRATIFPDDPVIVTVSRLSTIDARHGMAQLHCCRGKTLVRLKYTGLAGALYGVQCGVYARAAAVE